ncbi:hypothetical protein DSO57_1021331 [Entomophthora muscae]|uniref:Uncharacterized protein n=1 Tax=Entomophthora muscae TaxID=34485 RepID=A0ACC2U1A6_9FUNG|nr:hypothetical protein DSO57_1021331 [Entomophthora muscae]
MLLTLIINGLKPHICKWVPVGCYTSIDDCYKAIVEANNQASMGFRCTSDTLSQLSGIQSWVAGPVRIDNSPPPKPQAQEQESNLEPGSPQAAGLMDCGTACPHFSGVKPLQADAEDDGPSSETDQAKEIIALIGVPITTPNGGAKATTISFMSLKSSQETNQEPTQERGTGLQPGPMTTTLKQDNQVAKSRFLTNERTPGPSTILLPLDPSTQFPWPCLSQCPDDSPWKILSLEVGYYIDQRTPRSKLIAIFE